MKLVSSVSGGLLLRWVSVVVVGVLRIGLCAEVWAKSPVSEEYWKETGLTFRNLPIHSACYEGEREFNGCVKALNVAAQAIKPKSAVLIAKEMLGDPAVASSKVLEEFKGLVLAEITWVTDPKEGPAAYWARALARMQRERLANSVLFHAPQSERIDFGSLLERLHALAARPDYDSALAARMYNVFLSAVVDPHTHIDAVREISEEVSGQDESIVGIGTQLGVMDKQIFVERPTEGGPAFKAGIKAKDVIKTVDGQDASTMGLESTVKAIRGSQGTPVKLTVLRKGKILAFTIVRAPVSFERLSFKMLSDTGYRFGYIRLVDFMNNNACGRIKDAINQFERQNAQGLILDLRGNGGGLLNQAVCLGGLFVGKNVIVETQDIQSGEMTPGYSTENQITSLPLMTLVDPGSASASEILAGALQDYQRSWIAGARTYGKATVQDAFEATRLSGMQGVVPGSVRLYMTVARFYQPSERTNQVVGITPDFEIDPFPGATDDDRFAMREGDLFENALPPASSQSLQPRDESKIARIKKCAAQNGIAQRLFLERQDAAIPPDFQLLSAQDLLGCALR